jgi:heme-degrading monooxygenase HmoA
MSGKERGRSSERPARYVLLVYWETLEDHTEGFRKSDEYGEWKRSLHHFYDPFPTVGHFELVHGGSEGRASYSVFRIECASAW